MFINSDLVNAYIPFLPLEKIHVKQCVNAALPLYVNSRDIWVEELAEEVEYFSVHEKQFSKYGCKRVDEKIRVAIELLGSW